MHIEIAKECKKQQQCVIMQDSNLIKLQGDNTRKVLTASWYLKGSASLEKSCTTAMFWLIWHKINNSKKQREAFTPKQQHKIARLLLSYCLNCRRQHLQHDFCLVCCKQQKKQMKQCKCSSNSSLLSLSNNTTNENTTTIRKTAQIAGKMHSSQTTSTGKCSSCGYYCFCCCSNCCLHYCRYYNNYYCCYYCYDIQRHWHILFKRAKFIILLIVAHNRNDVNVEYNDDDDSVNVVIQKNKFMTSQTTSPICLTKHRYCAESTATSRYKIYIYLLRTFLSARNLTKVYVKNLTNTMQQRQQQQNKDELHATTTKTTFTKARLAKAKILMNKSTINNNNNNITMKSLCIRQNNSSNMLLSRRHKLYTLATCNKNAATTTTINCSNITIANESLQTALQTTTADTKTERAQENVDKDEKKINNNNNNNELAAAYVHYDDVCDVDVVHDDSLMAKSMWKVGTCQAWCSFILFIEKQIRNEKNLLTNIFYTKQQQQQTVISTCSSNSNNKNNNNHKQYNNNSYIIMHNISNNSGQTKCLELQRLNSQRDYDTSKYNNREICRFLNKSSSYKTINTIENKHNLNKCNNKIKINIQQQNNNNNNKNNNTDNIHHEENFMQMNNNYNSNNVHNNYISQLQQTPPPTPQQQKEGNQKQQKLQSGNAESIACDTQKNATAYKNLYNNSCSNNNMFMNSAMKQPLLRILLLLLTLASFATAHAQVLANSIMTNAVVRTSATSSLPSTIMPVTLTRNETVCRSLDLRNTPSDFRQLQNCTVVEGFLLLSLVNTHKQMEFDETYPLLTEVSEFIVVYRVHNLRSLAQIFPNLAIIRGRVLFEGYALAIYSNPQLEELGLTKLISISRGGVRIENNLSLCFVQTVYWEGITNSTEHVIRNNRPPLECPLCPGDHKLIGSEVVSENELSCKKSSKTGKRHCWNSNSCQTICPNECLGNCVDENTCCNKVCIGGCSPTNPNICIGCRNFTIDNSSCIDKCPSTYYNYVNRRCITAATCAGIGTKYENNKSETLIAYNGNCTTYCPAGFSKVNATCEPCGNKCSKKCEGGLIDSVQHAKDMYGCTHIIKQGLTISIKRGGRYLMEDLEYGLSAIKTIDTFLKVHLTYGMYSLEFFKSLETIRGQTLYEDRFSLYVLENNDLEKIWGPKQNVSLENGRVFFHFNPKLCYAEIEKLLPMMKDNSSFIRSEVATDSNGSKGSCNTDDLNVEVTETLSDSATVEIKNPLKFDDERTFIGYIYYLIEDKFGNATKHGYRPCDDGWTPSDPTKQIKYTYSRLAPFTQYAYYVKTMTISMEPRNAQSEIAYFKTKSSQPQPVEWMKAYANSSSEIVLSWAPPLKVNGKLAKYKVRAVLNRLSQAQELESRNYCKNPLPVATEFGRELGGDVQKTTDNPQNADCRCGPGEKSGYSYKSEEADTPTISEAMSFENALQNFVYVKHSKPTSSNKPANLEAKAMRRRRRSHLEEEEHSNDSFLLRHIRDVPNRLDEGAPYSSLNASKMDASSKYYEIVVDYVNATTTQYVFSKLKHFAIYHLSVEACREPEEGVAKSECSNEKEQQMRTQKIEDVDKVHNFTVNLEATNNTRHIVRVRWKPPENPNGMVVSYTIATQLIAEDSVEEKKCITDQDYRKYVDGYPIPNLAIGNYSIRVRANTLAGEGVYSDPRYVEIPPSRISNTVIAIIVLTIVSFLLMVGAFLYYLRKKLLPTPSDLKMFPSVNPYYISLQYIPDDWEVSRERVIQLSPLGQGSFGMVYEGILKSLNEGDEDTPCAIKTVNENATDRERMNFLNEASVMKQFDTFHVVRLLGVCSRGQPALVVMELMKNGDLKSYLRAHRPDEREDGVNGYVLPQHEQLTSTGGGTLFQPPPLSRIYQMAIEIADGMAYLSAKKFVHRDLAARNCMVAADLTVKIGDFGMTRDIYETDYYRKGTKGLLPVRWMPPESLRDGIYSSSSDVFSYGVVLWEMVTLASQPYQGLSNDQVLRYVIDGGVMVRPENCPDQLYCLMQNCWHHRPSARPTFMEIITHLLDHANATFRQVSFYYSAEGEQVRQKEMSENLKHSDGIFHDRENEMDDVTTPLRVGEYNEYKMNMGNNSSVENQDGSPIALEDEPQHSAYSMGFDINASSTPEGQLHTTGPNIQLFAPKLANPNTAGSSGGYVHTYPPALAQVSNPIDIVIQKSIENDERGYEVYDPSPHYQLHALDDNNADDCNEDDEADASLHSGMVGEHLLPRKKRQPRAKTSAITIRPMSSSMPDEPVGGGMTISSSLHPSTASAASSNASSTATATSKYPSLKKTMAETMHNVGHNLRNINKRLFQSHKRSGSTGSQKSIQLQPTVTTPTSTTNMAPSAHLATIESGGSGSAGSYCISPRFFTPAAASDNPNYQPYDINYQALSENPNYEVMQAPTNNVQSELMDIKNAHISDNPNYQMMEPPTASSTGFLKLDAALRQEDERESFLCATKTSSSGSDTFSETETTVANAGSKKRKRKHNKSQKPQIEETKTLTTTTATTTVATTTATATTAIPTTTTSTTTTASLPLSRFSLKEKWLRQQQQQQTPSQQSHLSPPPNGFIG